MAIGSPLAGKLVLIFGDSHVANMAPGKALLKELDARKCPAWTNGLKNRSAVSVARDEKATLDGELALGPHIVLLVLGTNDVPNAATVDAYRALKTRIEKAGAEAWLVGPPSFPSVDEQLKATQNMLLQAPIFGRTWIDSMRIIDRSTAGRIAPSYVHFDDAGGQKWATGIVRELVQRIGRRRLSGVMGVVAAATALGAAILAPRSRFTNPE
jgi:hypothetical protein